MAGATDLKSAEDYRKEFIAERERLAKLWDAYEQQEKEVAALKNKITMMEREIGEKERIIRSLKDVLEARDRENRELEIELTSHKAEKSSVEPKLNELQSSLRVEKERFAKLFKIAEDLDQELKTSRSEIQARDEWFRIHVDSLRNIGKAIEERDRMVEAAKGRAARGDYKSTLDKLGK